MAFETEVVSHDIGTICARILEQKKRYLSFFSNTTLNVLHRLKMRCSHLCVMKLVHQFRNFFFWLLSLFFVCFSSFFFVLLFFFFFFFIPKETKSACVSTTTHQRTHKRKNNTNERKSIDQIIIKNQKCKARDTRTCSSANARAGKT